jgi:hypothetical protein
MPVEGGWVPQNRKIKWNETKRMSIYIEYGHSL